MQLQTGKVFDKDDRSLLTCDVYLSPRARVPCCEPQGAGNLPCLLNFQAGVFLYLPCERAPLRTSTSLVMIKSTLQIESRKSMTLSSMHNREGSKGKSWLTRRDVSKLGGEEVAFEIYRRSRQGALSHFVTTC